MTTCKGFGAGARAVALVLLLVSTSWTLVGQTFYGGIRGRVTDESGAAVVNSIVTLIDERTEVARSTSSNEQGEYVFSAVNPGTYRLTAETAGFSRFDRRGIVIETQSSLVIDVRLEVGAVTESVEVVEETPLIETGRADTGQVVDRQKLIDLPNIGRNTWLFSQVTPSVIWAGRTRNVTMHDQSCTSTITIGGGLVRSNNYLIDGVSITDTRNRPFIVPNLESIEEVKLQVQSYDAEMGRTGGGVFNSYMKSGTNELHGAVYQHFRPNATFANNFFNNRAGLPKPESDYKDWGGSVGGPVWLPGVYDGRNRTFFYLTFEDYARDDPVSRSFSLPTMAERNGDFSNSFNANGSLRTIYDPFTRTAFQNNIIPEAMINDIGRNIASYYPEPTQSTAFYGAQNYAETRIVPQEDRQYTGKLDHNFASWWRASLSYMHHKSIEPGQHWWAPNSTEGSGGGPPDDKASIAGGSSTWTLFRFVDSTIFNNTFIPNPTTVVAVRYGFNRFPNFQSTVSGGFDVRTLGFSDSYAASAKATKFPRISMQTLDNLGGGSGDLFEIHWYTRVASVSVSKFQGNHSLKMGFDYRGLNTDLFAPGASTGEFSFNENFTRQNPLTPNNTGTDLASLLMGYPSGGDFPAEGQFFTYLNYYAGYIQDDIRLLPNLTVNAGLRYEYETGMKEQYNNFTVGFDRDVLNPIAANVIGVETPNLAPGVNGILPKGGLLFAGVRGNATQNGNPTTTKFGPRLGIAWSPSGKTTLRGGYGVFWVPTPHGDLGAPAIGAWGYSAVTSYVASEDGGITPANSLNNPYPDGINQPVGNSLGLLTQVGNSLTFVDQNRRGGYLQHFSVDVQRQLPGNVALTIGYVGSRGRHLPRAGTISGTTGAYDINELEPKYYGLGQSLFDSVPNPFYGRGGTGLIGTETISRAQLLRPFPQFGSIQLIGDSNARSRFDSLIIKAQKRFSGGFSFLLTYTLSKNLTDAFADSTGVNSGGGYQTTYDLDREYSLAYIHTPNRFTSTISYQLPFGLGKPLLNGSRALDWVVGGWQFNGLMIIQNGYPLAITQQNNQNGILFAGGQRPNATGMDPATPGSPQDRLDNYLNPDAFFLAPRFTFGNISRTIPVYGPGINSWDLSMFKTFTFAEKWRAQFRIEAFNAFNTPQFTTPNRTWGNPNFGRIQEQLNTPRFLQLGLRFFF